MTVEPPPKGAIPIYEPDFDDLWFAVRAILLGALLGIAFGVLLVTLVS